MRIIKKPSSTEVIIEKSYTKEDIKRLEGEILKAKCKEMHIPGFRPGNAPLAKIREKLVESHDWEELMGIKLQEKIISDWSQEKDAEMGEIVKIINVKSTKSEPLILECHFEYFPRLAETDIGDKYKRLKIASKQSAADIKVSDKEVEEGLSELQKRRTILKPVAEPLGKDKFAFIVTDSPKKDLFQWGIGQFGEEFDKKTEGMKEGEEKEIDGKKIKVEKIFVSEAPEVNDEFAESLGHFHDLSDLKLNMKKGMKLEKLHKELEARREALIKSLLEAVKIEVPNSIVERSAASYKKDFENQLGKLGALHKGNKALDRPLHEDKVFEEKARRELKLQRVLESIALKEKIVPSDDEVDKEMNKILQSFSKPKEARDALGNPDELKPRVFLSLCFDKTLRFLEKENQATSDIEMEISKIEKEQECQHENCNHDH